MKKTFTISIPSPCHEKWEKFNPTTLGGFCSSCQKEVIDFTTWDEDRIKSYFKKRSQTCGRFFPYQLKSYTLDQAPKFNFLRWTYAPLLSLLMFLFSRNAQAQIPIKAKIEKVQLKREIPPVRSVTGQAKVIKGVVKSAEDQSTLPGVNVVLKGTAVGTVTDADGRFSISIPNPKSTDSLVFSFIGLETVFLNVNESNDLAVFMNLDVIVLGESIVVGGICARRFSVRGLWWRMKRVFSKNY